MQEVKERFTEPDLSHHGSVQSCVRTNDLNEVGDGSHLTYFEMVGNFSFGCDDYLQSVILWHLIIQDLGIPVTHVTYYPGQTEHQKMWESLGYRTVPDTECKWSDGNIGGYCCEMFVGDLEIGNLVNTLSVSTDVGFGLERLLQVVENKQRVDQTSIFRQDVCPVVRDHVRFLSSMIENDITPGSKGRNSVCRKVIQRLLKTGVDLGKLPEFRDWLIPEKELQERRIEIGRRKWRKFGDRSEQFWFETYGLTTEDLEIIKDNNE